MQPQPLCGVSPVCCALSAPVSSGGLKITSYLTALDMVISHWDPVQTLFSLWSVLLTEYWSENKKAWWSKLCCKVDRRYRMSCFHASHSTLFIVKWAIGLGDFGIPYGSSWLTKSLCPWISFVACAQTVHSSFIYLCHLLSYSVLRHTTKNPDSMKSYPSLILYYFVHCWRNLTQYLTCNRCSLKLIDILPRINGSSLIFVLWMTWNVNKSC